MADKELFEADDELDSDFEELEEAEESKPAKAPRKKRSLLKWFFIMLVLLILAAAALLGLDRLGYIDLPLDDYINVEQLFEGSKNTLKVEPEELAKPLPLPPPKRPDKSKQDTASKQLGTGKITRGYYLQVGSCLYESCRKELTRRMHLMKLPVISQPKTQNTTYYELVSDASFYKKRAEEKLRLLNKYNETIGFPYLIKSKKDRYVISFGQFPQEATAVQMKSQLEHLFPQIRMRFHIRPKKDRVAITKLFVGPYKKSVADKVRIRLREDPDFEWIEVVKLP